MKKLLSLLTVGALLLGLGGCSQTGTAKTEKDNKQQTVVFWHSLSGALGDELNAVVKE